MLKVTIKGSTAADLIVNLLALAASMSGGAPVEVKKEKTAKTDKSETATTKTETSATQTTASTGATTSAASPTDKAAITLADLQALGSRIQGLKTKDPAKGAEAVAKFKQAVTDAGATRLSDPNLSADKFPAVKKALEAICTEYGI